jgi:hypothetical protein
VRKSDFVVEWTLTLALVCLVAILLIFFGRLLLK